MAFKDSYLKLTENVNNTKGSTKVSIVQGRFQPITSGHIKVIDQARSLGYPVVLLIVRGAKSQQNNNNPIPEDLQKELISISAGNKISMMFTVPNGYMGTYVNTLRDNDLEPVALFTGSDRMKNYLDMNDRTKELLDTDIEIKEIKRDDTDISASKVRDLVKNNKWKEFQDITTNISKEYFEKLKEFIK